MRKEKLDLHHRSHSTHQSNKIFYIRSESTWTINHSCVRVFAYIQKELRSFNNIFYEDSKITLHLCDLRRRRRRRREINSKWLATRSCSETKTENPFSLVNPAQISAAASTTPASSSMIADQSSDVSASSPTGSSPRGWRFTTSRLNCTRWVGPIAGKFTSPSRWGWLSRSVHSLFILKSRSLTLASTPCGLYLPSSSSSSIA